MSDLVEAYVTGHQRLPPERWKRELRAEGFTVDGHPAERPAEGFTVYRGSAPERRFALSWTTSQAVALRWATSEGQRPAIGRLWVIEECPPDAMLGMWSGRHEAEVLIDCEFPGVNVRAWTPGEIQNAPPMQSSAEFGITPPTSEASSPKSEASPPALSIAYSRPTRRPLTSKEKAQRKTRRKAQRTARAK